MINKKQTYPSISEEHGIAALKESDRLIYSIGVSTGGVAEARMANASVDRKIIATTIDSEGAQFVEKQWEEVGLLDQMTIKVEDVSSPLPYPNGYFDFVYARLVLHYLPKDSLKRALDELYRILKANGRLFVVVRSAESFEVKDKNSTFDPATRMTTYTSQGRSYSRHFHTQESIQAFLTASGFQIQHVKMYEEQLCVDFHRTVLSEHIDLLIEVLASKSF